MREKLTGVHAPSRRGRSVLAAGLVGLVLAGCTGTQPTSSPTTSQQAQQGGTGATVQQPTTIPGTATNVLQSVQVQVAPTGQVGTIDSTAIATDGSGSTGTTVHNQWSGTEASTDLPVRVQAAYRLTDDSGATRTGTNLSELEGHSGHVEIDLTVQNLTAKPTDVSVDVDGRSQTHRMMVGVPLAVVASTSMPGVSTQQVVTPTTGSTRTATNGVLSQDAKGTTVVQWATLLAPPRTGGSTTLHLVVDAKDFQAPTFDLSVQPGLVADASLGSLLDASMAPAGSRELDLQRQTVALVGQVNTVLGQANTSIGSLRDNLATTSRTLGSRTAQDMAASSQRLAASMKSLDSELTQLKGSIASSTDQTNKVVMDSLSQTVQVARQMLGDTSATPAAPTVTGTDCHLSTSPSTRATSVYQNLMQVVGAMDAYTRIATGCHAQVQAQIAALLGPKDPTAANACPAATTVTDRTPLSVTCSMYLARQRFDTSVAAQLQADGQAALAALQPEVMTGATASADTLSQNIDELATRVAALDAATKAADAAESAPAAGSTPSPTAAASAPTATTATDLSAVTAPLERLGSDLSVLDEQRESLHTRARAGADQAAGMVRQNADAAQQLCSTIATPASATPASATPTGDASSADATPGATATADPSESPSGTASPSDTTSPSATPSATPSSSDSPQATSPTQAATGAFREAIERVRALLTTDSCPDAEGKVSPLARPDGYPQPMSVLLEQQVASWTSVLTATDTTSSEMAKDLTQLRADVAAVQAAVDQAGKQASGGTDQPTVTPAPTASATPTPDSPSAPASPDPADQARQEAARRLDEAVARLKTDRADLATHMTALKAQQDALAKSVGDAFAKAAKDGSSATSAVADVAVRQTAEQETLSSEALDDLFQAASQGLAAQSQGLGQSAAKAVEQQEGQVATTASTTRQQVSQQLAQGLSQIATTVGTSTRDTQAANVQLATDLRSVLLDLGTAKVGGKGLLGAMTTSADTASSTSAALATAGTKVTNYANQRNQDIVALLTEQAQDRASIQQLDNLPPFRIVVPATARHRTVYTFHVGTR